MARETVGNGAVVWDIGANVGLFSFAAAGLAGCSGKVYAIEPDTFLVGVLRRSVAIPSPRSAPVEVIPCAVFDTVGIQQFQIAERARASNFLEGLGNSMTGGVRETQSVLCVSVDWLATQILAPDVLKIDAEGAELRILNGARELLLATRPTIICEVGKENEDGVASLLGDLGYVLYDGAVPKKERRPVSGAPWTTLALPLEARVS
jgi:FkbM family methyltransferase